MHIAVKSPVAMLITLFATFSIALHIYIFTLDTPVLLLMICYWLVNGRNKKLYIDHKWLFIFAWMNVIWISLLFLWHVGDFDNTDWVVGTGLRLILYFIMFIVAFDVVQKLSKSEVMTILRWAWIFSIIVSIIAIYQHYVLGYVRINSILESHHAHLGDYATGAVIICGLITVWAEGFGEKMMGILTCILALVALVVSENRANIVGIGVGLSLFGILKGFKGLVIVTILVGVIYSSGVVNHVIQKEKEMTFQESKASEKPDTFGTTKYDGSSVDRILGWVGILNFEQHADLIWQSCGVGPGNFGYAMRPYFTLFALYNKQPGTALNGAHNNYLHVMVELGFIGFILFWGFIIILGVNVHSHKKYR